MNLTHLQVIENTQKSSCRGSNQTRIFSIWLQSWAQLLSNLEICMVLYILLLINVPSTRGCRFYIHLYNTHLGYSAVMFCVILKENWSLLIETFLNCSLEFKCKCLNFLSAFGSNFTSKNSFICALFWPCRTTTQNLLIFPERLKLTWKTIWLISKLLGGFHLFIVC